MELEQMTGARMNAANAMAFILSGNAYFTLVSGKTGVRYTFHVEARKEQKEGRYIWFVKLLTGSDNRSDYTYMGKLQNRRFSLTKKSRYNEDSAPYKAMRWVIEHLVNGQEPPNVQIWHEGRCGRCSRPLTVPSSIMSGLGPECQTKVSTGGF